MKTLTLDSLREIVPAAFADGPSSRASERYAFIPTEPLIHKIRERGFEPVRAHQSKRTQDTVHAIHSITFRDPRSQARVGDVLPEITLVNSHNLMRRYSLLAGLFRLACSNGMVTSLGIGESKSSRIHLDDANLDVLANLDIALARVEEAYGSVQEWQKTELPWLEVQNFARDAILIKNGGDQYWSKHFQPHEFLRRRREADQGNDLWTVFNVVQENIMRGGVQGVTRETRPITQVREVVRINQDLWQLAEKYGTIHGRN